MLGATRDILGTAAVVILQTPMVYVRRARGAVRRWADHCSSQEEEAHHTTGGVHALLWCGTYTVWCLCLTET